jgi:hypothetical protein
MHDAVYPCYLGFVDLEMWAVGAVLSLRDEDVVAVGGGEFGCCYWSTKFIMLAMNFFVLDNVMMVKVMDVD